MQRYRDRSKTNAEVSGHLTMKPVCIILQKKNGKYSSIRSPFLSGWRKTGHVQVLDKHGSPEGLTKVNMWQGGQSTPTPYTIPKRVHYFKPKKTIYSTKGSANPQRNRVYAQFVDQDGLPINEQKVQQRLQGTFFNTLTRAQNVIET